MSKLNIFWIMLLLLTSMSYAQMMTFEVTQPGEEFTYDVRSDYNSYAVGVSQPSDTNRYSQSSDLSGSSMYGRTSYYDDYPRYYRDEYYYDGYYGDYYDRYSGERVVFNYDDDNYPRYYRDDYNCYSDYCRRRVYTRGTIRYYGNRSLPRYPARDYYYPSSSRRYRTSYNPRYDSMYYRTYRSGSNDINIHYYPTGFTGNPRADLDFFLNNPELFD